MNKTQSPRPESSPPRRVRSLEILSAIALLVVLAIMLFDWNMLKGPIERRVEAATGREFRIDGNLSVDLSMTPRITVDGIYLGNQPGAKDAQMAAVKRLDFRLHLLDLLRGEVLLSEVRVQSPEILLEKNQAGRANWIFGKGETDWPSIRQMAVSAGTLTYRNPASRTDIDFTVESGDRSKDVRLAPLLIDGKGRYADNPVEIEGRIESPLVLKDPGKPYRIDLRARAGATRASAKGYLIGPFQMQGFDLQFGLSGPDMALLYPLTGIAIPQTPPYRLMGKLTRTGKTWRYDDFSGIVGDSDLGGDASVDTSGKRPFLRADMVSKRLDFDDLAGFVGAPPQTGGSETASTEQKQQAAQLRASGRVLPDEPFKLDKLRSMDADVKLRAHRVNAPSLPLDAMTAHLFLEAGVLRLDPLSFGVAGGEISSTIRLDARKEQIATDALIRAKALQLQKLFPTAKLTQDSAGRISGTIDLEGNGNSIARMLAGADGEVGLIMGSGKISNLLLEFAGIDIAEALKFLITKDRTVPIRCAFGDFKVTRGIMQTERLVFDTTDTVIFGEGTVNLRDERLSLRLKPQPKDRSLFSLRSPLLVSGTFKDPTFKPDLKRVTLRAVAAAVLGSLVAPAALLAVYERGPGEDIACQPGAVDASAPRKDSLGKSSSKQDSAKNVASRQR